MNEVYKTPESEDDKLEGLLVNKINQNNWTAAELKEAYYVLCGVSDSPVSERVEEIKVLMEEMTNKHYPLNRFVNIIDGLGNWEDSDINFSSFVKTLNISQKEKDILESIVRQKRTGELICVVDGDSIATYEIKESTSSRALAYALLNNLSQLLASVNEGGKKSDISFWFEEKQF